MGRKNKVAPATNYATGTTGNLLEEQLDGRFVN
jgi:hypothetical protein